MGFLRRVFGGGRNDDADAPAGGEGLSAAASTDDEERTRERELARFDYERVDDLIRRQQRYADRSWTPPRQGGERRAEDDDRTD